MPGMEDRLLVEKLLNTCLVPYNLESADRMKKLYLLFATIDENASKAFIEVQTKQETLSDTSGEFSTDTLSTFSFQPISSLISFFHITELQGISCTAFERITGN